MAYVDALTIENDGRSYGQLQSIYKNLTIKQGKGTYSSAKAVTLFKYLVESYLKRVYGSYGAVSPAERTAVARDLRDTYEARYRAAGGFLGLVDEMGWENEQGFKGLVKKARAARGGSRAKGSRSRYLRMHSEVRVAMGAYGGEKGTIVSWGSVSTDGRGVPRRYAGSPAFQGEYRQNIDRKNNYVVALDSGAYQIFAREHLTPVGSRAACPPCPPKGRRAVDPVTPVIFRMWPRGSVDALFPTISEGRGLIRVYAHVGQHGTADYNAVIGRTRPAKPAEYASLLRELKQIGYDNLKVVSRKPARS